MIDRVAKEDPRLADWQAMARGSEGSPWLRAAEAEALACYALQFGEGVSTMEAVATQFREPVRDVSWEIIGADAAGENWEDHRDPARALDLVRRKLALARQAGAVLEYKLWLAPGPVAERLPEP
ncbi:hypothetical protein [Antarctobacter jejuensis]|uniref:hypothetical protein n=1 Tax=Antarctobacter jejuensis TaxID=1439938 RepID=UPI003FD03A82